MFLKCLGSITSCARHKKNRLNGLSEICRKQRMSQLNVLLCDFWIRRHDRADGRSRSGQNDPEFNSFFYAHATEARAFLWTIPTAWLGSEVQSRAGFVLLLCNAVVLCFYSVSGPEH